MRQKKINKSAYNQGCDIEIKFSIAKKIKSTSFQKEGKNSMGFHFFYLNIVLVPKNINDISPNNLLIALQFDDY